MHPKKSQPLSRQLGPPGPQGRRGACWETGGRGAQDVGGAAPTWEPPVPHGGRPPSPVSPPMLWVLSRPSRPGASTGLTPSCALTLASWAYEENPVSPQSGSTSRRHWLLPKACSFHGAAAFLACLPRLLSSKKQTLDKGTCLLWAVALLHRL